MSLAAPHIGLVFISYGLSALVLIGLILTLLWQSRRAARRLEELEARATRRRKPAKGAENVS